MATFFEQKIIEIYIPLLGRAPDAAGLGYWAEELRFSVENAGLPVDFALKALTNNITLNPEWLAAPGLGANDPLTDEGATAIISGMYSNMFQRPAEDFEVAYWQPLFTNGSVTSSEMALALILGIQQGTTDELVFSLKSQAATYFVENIGSLYTDALAKEVIQLVFDARTLAISVAITDLLVGRPVILTGPFDYEFDVRFLDGGVIDHQGTGDLRFTIDDGIYDLRGVTATGGGDVICGFPADTDTTLAPTTILPPLCICELPANGTVTMTATQANGQTGTGSGNIVVTDLGNQAVDLSGFNNTGSKTIVVDADTIVNPATMLGGFGFNVIAPATLAVTAEQADALPVFGDGNVLVTGLTDQAVDFSGFTNTGSKTVLIAATSTQNANTDLDGFIVNVPAGITYTATAAQAATYADAIGGGVMRINGADDSDDVLGFNFSGVTQELFGGTGSDTFNVLGGNATLLDFTLADDLLNIASGVTATLTAPGSVDLSGGNITNNGTLVVVHGGTGTDDVLVGTAGIDTIDYRGAAPSAGLLAGGLISLLAGASGITVTLDGVNAVDVLGGETDIGDQNILDLLGQADTLAGFENVFGTNADDTITGDANANSLSGAGGNDTLDGAGGEDVVVGNDGSDTIIAGDDVDEDVVAGLSGIDAIVLTDAVDATDEVHFRFVDGEAFSATSTGDTVTDFAAVAAAAGGDQLVFLDNGTAGGAGAVDFANSIDVTSGAKGTLLSADDLQTGLESAMDVSTAMSGADAAGRGADNDVLVFNGAAVVFQVASDTFDAVNSYVVVDNGNGDAIVVFDADWNDTAGREHIVTLTGVSAADLVASNFEVYTTV